MLQLRKRDSRDSLIGRAILYSILMVAAIATLIFVYLKNRPEEYYTRTEYLLGTYVTIKVASEKISPVILADAAFREITRIDKKFGSDRGIVKSMAEAGENGMEVDEETAFLLSAVINIAEKTGGAFDPTIYPITKLWGFDSSSSKKRVPSEKEIEKTLERVGYKNIVVDVSSSKVWILNGAELDLSGIAKGYAVDLAIARIKSMDETATGFIDAGGDIGIIGPKYGKRPWVIGIRNPRSDRADDVIEYVYMYDGAIATSGDYERYFIEDGIRYHHIFNPTTGRPARSGVISATVISKSALEADAFATAAFVIGTSPGITFFPRYGALVMLVMEDLSTYKSPGFEVYQKK